MSTEMQTKVQASPAQSFTPVQTGLLQRQSALCNTPGLVEDSGRDKEKLTLQRSSADQAGTTTVPRFGHDFSRVSVHSNGAGMIQAKLKINEPGDIYEQEADRVADAVMRMPENAPVSGQVSAVRTNSASFIQRQTIEETLDEEEPEELTPILESVPTRDAGELGEEVEEELIQPKSNTGAAPQVTPGIAHDIHSFKGIGQPLTTSERTFFEPRFGRDFNNVRVHTNERAARTAQSINARAFTLGRDVVFGAGQYSPASHSGRSLLAHELTHVVQQNDGAIVRQKKGAGSVESDAARIESLLSYGIFDWAITDKDAIEALEILSNLPTSMQEAVLRRINIGRLRENLPKTHQHILTEILDKAGGEPAVNVRTTVERIQDLLSYGLFDWAITDEDATKALKLLLSLPPDEQQRVVLVINYKRLYDNLPTEKQKNQLRAIRDPAAARETKDVAMMEGYRARARIILKRIKANASALTIPAPPAGGVFETWLSRNYLSSYCKNPSRSAANTAIAQITEKGAGGFSHYGYGLLRGMADRAYKKGITFIDSPYLLGTPAPGAVTGGRLFDPWSQGPNLTDLMHFAAGMKWSWIPTFLIQWYFIHYEKITHEGWQIFGLDALNDVIAEEGGRLFANDLKSASVTCSGSGVVDLDNYFLQGRRFLRGHLNESRLDHIALRVYQPNLVIAVNATGEIVVKRSLWNATIMEQIMSGASDADILATPDAKILMMLYHLIRIG